MLVLLRKPTKSELAEACAMLEGHGYQREPWRPVADEPAFSELKSRSMVQFNGTELQLQFTHPKIDKSLAQQIIDELIRIHNPVSFYSSSDNLARKLARMEGKEFNLAEYAREGYDLRDVPYGRKN